MVPWQTVPDYTIHGNTCCSLVEMIGQGTGLRFISRTPATLYSVIVMTGKVFSITASMKVPASGEEWKLPEWRMQRLNTLSSSLQIANRSFAYASPYLWNQLPSSFRQPHSVHSPSGSPHPVHITSSQSPPSLSSPYHSLDLSLQT